MKLAILCVLVVLCTEGCSSVASSAPEVGLVPFSVRVSLPLHAAFNRNAIPASTLSTTGGPGSTLGLVVQIPALPVGSTILQLDARVRDSAIGPTRVALAFGDQVDVGFQQPGLPLGSPSSGAGGPAFQDITLTGISRLVQPLHVYWAAVALTQGAQPVEVSAIDVTYLPPAGLAAGVRL